jgi:hypothetical protein
MNIAAIIVGIDGWEKYTLPLVESIRQYEPTCDIVIVDNASAEPYPVTGPFFVQRTQRICYSRAINLGHASLPGSDWYIVLSNDVLCTGPFLDTLAQYGDGDLVGPLLKEIDIERVGRVPYLEGWCVAVSRRIWDTIGGFDDGMQISSYEDVEYSHRARVNGFGLVEDTALPFVHLDQKQRFYLVPDYWNSEYHNRARFIEKYGQQVTA